MSLADALIKLALAKYAAPLVECIKDSNIERARGLVEQIEREYPSYTAVVRATFSGTPAQVVEACAALWPAVREVPGAERFAGLLQRRLLDEWERPRSILPRRRS